MNFHWLSRALLGGVALTVMSAGAQADELSALKAQLEALQSQVNQLEARPAAPAMPEGASWITFQRGTEATADWNTNRAGDEMPTAGGFTVAITPTADMPAPVHEVTIAGYVKGDVIYDFDQDLGDFFSYTAIDGQKDQDHVRLHARQSRFNIKSKSDTAVGQVRTLIEGDFFSGGSFGGTDFRLRHAWGEWDVTPNWTFGAGQTWRNYMSVFTGITTVDFNGDVGLIGTSRAAQVRLQWHDGPMQFGVAAEAPQEGQLLNAFGQSSANIPDFTARFQYDAPGGHKFLVSGGLRTYHLDGDVGAGSPVVGPFNSDTKLGWAIQGAANINLADIATLTTSVQYGDGIGNYAFGANGGAYVDATGDIHTIQALGIFAGLIFNVTDTTSLNFGWGWTDQKRSDFINAAEDAEFLGGNGANRNGDVMSAHANIIWQPVQQLRLGWEVMWGQRQRTVDQSSLAAPFKVGTKTDDAVRAQFGAWFFF
ncbi:hypothetical protein FHS85_003356 [Rhodoligotrophos appendicifer]|uniref:DcaP family trimeric outer membrane transporter n=1 Tax=Rhodoligotrophos appendicifer TaxID=987056 RepID=UPI00118648F4|nr:DcaP family trimeric outer membrane transporter [Rhodoligotrophos appendicifer]